MSSRFEIVENINKCQFCSGSIRQNEPLSQRTTMKVGGNADLFICPSDSNSVVIATSILKKNRIPFFVLGGGSNVVAPDNGFRGAIISTENLNGISHETTDKAEKITFGSGTPTKDAVEYTCSRGISGLERFAGLPGTCGGAAFMNARCYNADFGNLIESISYIDLDSVTENYEESLEKSVRTYSSNFETDWSYKKSPFTDKNTVILSVKMKFSLADPSKAGNLEKECRKYIDDRESKGHFKFPSAGSVFKNNRDFGQPSGKLIDDAGLKGTEFGGAQIAPWHGNFIINKGNARASDIEELVRLAKSRVREKTGFNLECEIIFL